MGNRSSRLNDAPASDADECRAAHIVSRSEASTRQTAAECNPSKIDTTASEDRESASRSDSTRLRLGKRKRERGSQAEAECLSKGRAKETNGRPGDAAVATLSSPSRLSGSQCQPVPDDLINRSLPESTSSTFHLSNTTLAKLRQMCDGQSRSKVEAGDVLLTSTPKRERKRMSEADRLRELDALQRPMGGKKDTRRQRKDYSNATSLVESEDTQQEPSASHHPVYDQGTQSLGAQPSPSKPASSDNVSSHQPAHELKEGSNMLTCRKGESPQKRRKKSELEKLYEMDARLRN